MKKYILPLLTLLIFSCSPLRTYRHLPEVRDWEGDIQKFEQLDSTSTYPDNSILFTGSSSIRMWETLAEDMAPYHVIQRGYGGSKLSDFAVYADRIIYPHRSRAIVIFIANDISGADTDKSPRQVKNLFRHVVKTIRKEYPETPVFWIAITPTSSRWSVWPQVKEANNLIRTFCDNNPDLYYIDTEHKFLNDQGTPRDELFLPDMLHLNTDGYEVWTSVIKTELNKVLNQ